MTLHDVYLLSPELSLAALGVVVIILDMMLGRKGALAVVSVLGLAVPLAFSVSLWSALSGEPDARMVGIFDTLVVDKFSLFFKFLVMGVVALVVMSSVGYVSRIGRFQGEYYGLMLFSASGMMMLAATTDLISIYIALELTALPLAALAAFLRDSRSTEAGIKFLLLSAMSSAVLLYGMALTYGFTGATQLPYIFERLGSSLDPSRAIRQPRPVPGCNYDSGRLWVQDRRRALPDVGPGRVRGRADPHHGVSIGGQQGRGLRGHSQGVLPCLRRD